MKRTKGISLTILATAAMTACDSGSPAQEAEVRRCVDKNNVVVEEKNCGDWQGNGTSQGNQGNSFLQNYLLYHWLFGGNGGYAFGSRVYGGQLQPTPGLRSVSGSELEKNHYSSGGGRVGIMPVTGGGARFVSPPSSSGGFSSVSVRGGFGSSASGGGGGE